MRIDQAYCKELDRVVNIEDAREAFFHQDQCDAFTFICSDPDCRYSGPSHQREVRVTGVNHNKSPERDQIFRSPHFRKWDEHAENCIWMEYTRAVEELKGKLGDAQAKHRNRIEQRLSSPVIEKFYVPSAQTDNTSREARSSDLHDILLGKSGDERKAVLKEYVRDRGASSRSLDTLVSCYEGLKEIDELREVVEVVGRRHTTFRDLFRKFTFGITEDFHVYYGGAKLGKRYGKGFSLFFYDTYEELLLSLYVSSDDVASSKSYKMITDVVDKLEAAKSENPKPYVNVYWIGGIEKKDDRSYVQILSPKHLVLRFVSRQD